MIHELKEHVGDPWVSRADIGLDLGEDGPRRGVERLAPEAPADGDKDALRAQVRPINASSQWH